mmetsp:Transcript_475/g.1614  ORF Transcript_475/g.1614 Transcript_475/m.1614 type:complete len:384 (+) Transcript_475:135-1286(+)
MHPHPHPRKLTPTRAHKRPVCGHPSKHAIPRLDLRCPLPLPRAPLGVDPRHRRLRGVGREHALAEDVVRHFLRRHDGGRVQVAVRNDREEGRVHHAQLADAVDGAVSADDGGGVRGWAHLAGAARVVGRLEVLDKKLVDLCVGLRRVARLDLVAAQAVKGGLRHDLARDPDRGAEAAPVLVGRHVVEAGDRLHRRAVRRQRRRGPNVAARRGLVVADVSLHRVSRGGRRERDAVVRHTDRQKVQLNVGRLDAGPRADEAADLEVVGRAEPLLGDQPVGAEGALAREREVRGERDGLQHLVALVDLHVVLQVLPDTLERRHHPHAELREQLWRPDARQLQQHRRGDRAGAQDNLLVGGGDCLLRPTPDRELHALRRRGVAPILP